MTTDYREATGLNPNALTLADAARLLAKAGGHRSARRRNSASRSGIWPRTPWVRPRWPTSRRRPGR